MNQFTAAEEGDLQQLRVALTADNVNDVDDAGNTALHHTANGGYMNCFEYCLELGANVNASDHCGYTPLHYASSLGRLILVRVLLNAGALVDGANIYGWTPLQYAIIHKHVDVGKLLIDRGAKVSNIIPSTYVPTIPDWVTTFIASRSKCRCAAITIIGIHKYRRTTMTGNNDINVMLLISKHIWSTRVIDDMWRN
jgi:hypothetical protein